MSYIGFLQLLNHHRHRKRIRNGRRKRTNSQAKRRKRAGKEKMRVKTKGQERRKGNAKESVMKRKIKSHAGEMKGKTDPNQINTGDQKGIKKTEPETEMIMNTGGGGDN